jgi:hypothetical protein
MQSRRLTLVILFAVAPALAAQRVIVTPSTVPANDTTDHVDLAWKSAPAHASAGLVAFAYDSLGRSVSGQAVSWSSSDTTVATVAGTTDVGIVTARGFGSATITAKVGRVSGTILACVYGAAFPFGVTVIGPPTIPQGSAAQYYATVKSSGLLFPAPCVHWSTSNPAIAVTNRRGLVLGRSVSATKSDVTAFLGVP